MSFQFLDNLEKNVGKTKYQRFEISLGIEKTKALIPFDSSTKFEECLKNAKPKTQKQLTEIVKQFNGILE